MSKQKVAVITGVNRDNVGFGIARHLLELEEENQEKLTLVFACRNYTRASQARQYLWQLYPDATIDIVLINLNSVLSVIDACQVLKERYQSIDYLFLNAGYLEFVRVRWSLLPGLFLLDPWGAVESSASLVQACDGEINQDNMGKVFATNTFGHYVMMRELETLLCPVTFNGEDDNGDIGGRVIWTSSSTAQSECFNIKDWQGLNCPMPYESSKWACDLLAVALNNYYLQRQIKISSFTVSPGVCRSGIGNMPGWLVFCRVLLHYLFRMLGVESQNISGYNGATAAVFVALQPLVLLNYMLKYTSATTRWGKPFVQPDILEDLELNDAWTLLTLCESRYQAIVKDKIIK